MNSFETFRNKFSKFKKAWSLDEKYSQNLTPRIRFLLHLLPGIPVMGLIGICLWLFGLKQLAIAMWLFSVFEVLISVLVSSNCCIIIRLVLVRQYFLVIFSFAGTLYFGGILHSGGIVLVGLAGVLHGLSYLNQNQIRLIFFLYIATVILEALFQPYLKPHPEITPTANLYLFILHFLVITFGLYKQLQFFVEERIRSKKIEVDHLNELNTIKTNFYTNITHEFRTPLTVIMGLTGSDSEQLAIDSQNRTSMIHKNGIRLLNLVNQMLDLSKLEAREMKLNLIQSDIISYLRQLKEPFHHLAIEKNISLHFHTQIPELHMDFDTEKMDSIFGNLLSNAIKYSPENTEIIFSISEFIRNENIEMGYAIIPLSEKVSWPLLKLSVKDNGYGIEETEVPLVFNRFYQVSSHYSHQQKGAGIGLLLVKEMVKLMEGGLFISSRPGKGTEIVVFLPVTKNAEVIENAKTSAEEVPIHIDKENVIENDYPEITEEPGRLLIIEDNNDVVYYLKSILGERFSIFRAEDGSIGIKMALDMIPDVIISDILMPEKNGYEVCEIIKNDFRTCHIPVILLTAKADEESQIDGYKHGADAYITKPFNPKELLVRLQKLIEIRENLKLKYKTLATIPDAIPDNIQNPDEQFMVKIREIMDNHYSDDNFDSNELANKIGMSRSQLFRKLKALTGLTATHFIRYYRISIAKLKIQKTTLTISEIAYDVGFNDPAYFTRSFSKEFGYTPIEIRKKSRPGNRGNQTVS